MFGKLKQLTYERRQQGIDIIDLGMGNPDKPTPQHIVDKLSEVAQEARYHRYSASRGLFNLRREIAWYYDRRFGVQIDPEHEAISVIGTKEGLSHLALALVPNPTFPIHIYAIVIVGGSVVSISD
jgi:alanine-synthesizing transaminase